MPVNNYMFIKTCTKEGLRRKKRQETFGKNKIL
jgi:hypothetical protein